VRRFLNRSFLLRVCLPVILIAGVVAFKPSRDWIKQVFLMFQLLDVNLIRGYILSFGIWAPVMSFFLMVFQSVIAPLPAFLITFANAGLFGWWKGAILSWVSAMAGAALCFFIAKWYGRGPVERLTSKAGLEGVDRFFERYGNYAVFVARLLPFVSFDIVSYGAGLTSMKFWPFFLATGLGQLPATVVYSYVGGMLTEGTRRFVLALSLLFVLTALVSLWKKIYRDRRESESCVDLSSGAGDR